MKRSNIATALIVGLVVGLIAVGMLALPTSGESPSNSVATSITLGVDNSLITPMNDDQPFGREGHSEYKVYRLDDGPRTCYIAVSTYRPVAPEMKCFE